ncbi:MAG TPA: hypothetical protein DEH11_15070 [Actinobacteria bacterium]|nr:hypothetical protein [Actinomycetota bacterium]
MSMMWFAVSYLLHRARWQGTATRKGDPEAGALSLEARSSQPGLVVAAGIAYGIFHAAIESEVSNLP